MKSAIRRSERRARVTRRDFLRTGAAGGAVLVIGFCLPANLAAQDQEKPRVNPFNAWIRITQDGQVTLRLAKSEMGQGVMTALPMILADELEVEWSSVHVEQAETRPELYGDQSTGGSSSVRESWIPLRRVGAAAREMLITAAAQQWQVDRAECHAQNGAVIHGPRSRRLTYGDLVEAASKLPVPRLQDVPLKNPDNFHTVGRSILRIDLPSKVDGSARFGIDVKVPGMLCAVVARCRVFGGKVVSLNADKAKAVPGVRQVLEIPAIGPEAFSAGGVAVVADTTWAALQGRQALEVQWDNGPNASESDATLRQQFIDLLAKPGKTIHSEGDAERFLAGAARKVEAVYEMPFLAHATMEPMNCTADVCAERAEVWAPTQDPVWARDAVASVLGIKPEAVELHTTLIGGGFGRRYQADFVVEAAQVSKAVGVPIKVIWTREDDMRHDFYRQASMQKLAAAIDTAGNITAWHHRLATTSIRAFSDPLKKAKPEEYEIGEASGIPYAVPNIRVEYSFPSSSVPVSWWRSVEDSMAGFAIESFVDELAAAAGIDPLEFRLRSMGVARKVSNVMYPMYEPLDTERLKRTLQLAASRANWGRSTPKGRGRGVAIYYSYDSYVAEVAEVTVGATSGVRVNRVVCAVDCGQVINPDGVKAQMEGAIVYGLTAALKGAITIQNGAVQQSNFHDYPILRLDEMPFVEVHIVPSRERPTGAGEPGLPPIAPAVANAIFAATRKRIRRLPIRAEDLRV